MNNFNSSQEFISKTAKDLLVSKSFNEIFDICFNYFYSFIDNNLNTIIYHIKDNNYLLVNNNKSDYLNLDKNEINELFQTQFLSFDSLDFLSFLNIDGKSAYVHKESFNPKIILFFKNDFTKTDKDFSSYINYLAEFILAALKNIVLLNSLNDKRKKLEKNKFVLNAIEDLNQSLIGASNLKKISHIFLLTITGYITSSSACFYLRDVREKNFFKLINFTGNLTNPPQSLKIKEEKYFKKSEVIYSKTNEIKDSGFLDQLKNINPEVLFFFSTGFDENITGICTIGPKFSNEKIKDDQIKLTALMIQQILAPLKNAFFYEQLEKQNRYLLETNRLLKNEMIERKNAQTNEAKTSWKFKTILETAKEGFLELDKNNIIRNLNLQMSLIIGDKKENIIGKNILDFIDLEIDTKDFTTNNTENRIKSSSFEASFINKKNLRTKCLVNITKLPKNPMLSDTDESLSKFAMVTDISDLKNKEIKLSEYKHIISASRDIIAIISPEFMVTPMNEPAKKIFSGSENKDLKIYDFFKKDTFEGKLKQRILMASKGELSHTRIWLSPLTIPERKFYDLILYPYEQNLSNTSTSSIIMIMRDISQLKELEIRVLQSQKMEAIGTLAGGIAHDFNNILSGIIGYTELAALKSSNDESLRPYLDKILDAGHRATDLIRQILSFSRTGLDETEKRPVLVIPVVKEVLKLLKASLPSTIEINTEFEKGSFKVNTNPTHLHQIVMNLCTNAAHSMEEEGGALDISAGLYNINSLNTDRFPELKQGKYFFLKIKDSGQGIPPQNLERIFEPFFTTKPAGKGTGMGLAVALNIIKSMDGTITVSSRVNEGSTFIIYLPVIKDDKRDKESNKINKESIVGGSEHILLVDDEKVLVDMTSIILRELGYKVSAFTDCYEALESFKEVPDKFDLAILDQTMPKLTGIKLSKKLHEIQNNFPVILSSGYPEEEYKDKFLEANIHSFIMKPLERTKLAKVIRDVLEKKLI